MNYRCIASFSIRYGGVGLTEPSGLALAHNGSAFWTASDDTKAVFRISALT